MDTRNILVTGSEGNIGKALCAGLREAGYPHVWGLDLVCDARLRYISADIRDAGDLSAAFREAAPAVVFHLAGKVGRVMAEQAHQQALTTNVLGTLHVARLCLDRGARLIHISTSEVPPDGRPNNWYGLSKSMGEQVVDYYRGLGLKATVVRPYMVYSEHETQGEHRSFMIRAAMAVMEQRQFVVHENAERGWFHLDDAVRAFIAILEAEDPPERLCIGNPDIRPVKELVELIARTLDIGYKVRFEPQPPGMTLVKHPDLSAQAALGFEPKVTLEEGVKRVCAALKGGA